jgi:hypothetical protein
MMRFRNRRLWPLVTVTPLLALPLIAEPAHSQWRSAHAPAVQPTSLRAEVEGEPAPMNARSDSDQDGIPDDR